MVGRSGGGRALELAIGTGRIAVPLTELGVEVDGIELSAAMVEVLEAKGCDLDVWVGDMATVETGRTYGLVYLVFNTIFNLLTQDEQVACFENAARHLDEDGVFVVEAAVPSAWLPSDSYARPERVEADAVTLDVCSLRPGDAGARREPRAHRRVRRPTSRPISCRLAWPAELDLMARLAGLRLVERWGGWQRQPYTGRDQHVSVYRARSKATGDAGTDAGSSRGRPGRAAGGVRRAAAHRRRDAQRAST